LKEDHSFHSAVKEQRGTKFLLVVIAVAVRRSIRWSATSKELYRRTHLALASLMQAVPAASCT